MASELVRLADQLDPQPQPPEALAQAVAAIREHLQRYDDISEYNLLRFSNDTRTLAEDVRLLLAALDSAEQRAKRYLQQRDALIVLAESMDGALDMEGIGGEDHERLALVRGAIDLADGQVQAVTRATELLGDDEDAEWGN